MPALAGDALDALAVLVEAGQEEGLAARVRRLLARPVEARQRVGHHRRVERPQVGDGVHVVDGRGDVEGRGHRAEPYPNVTPTRRTPNRRPGRSGAPPGAGPAGAGAQVGGGVGRRRPIGERHPDPPAQHVQILDPPGPVGRLHALAQAGQGFARLDVLRLLVDQAALQPPALPRDPRRVQRQVLVLGHADGDRRELGQEGRAAQLPPARADAAHHLGLVAHPHLAQLDAVVQARRQVAHQLAEVDPLLGREVERGPVAAGRDLDPEELDAQPAGAGPLAGERQRLVLAAAARPGRARGRAARPGGARVPIGPAAPPAAGPRPR